MSAPAIVQGDRIVGQCPIHQIPNPATGAPQPSPPLPFSAPLALGLVSTVQIGGKPAAVLGSSGYNTPPHIGLHPSDPYLVPTMQEGKIVSGSGTVQIGGKPAATAQSACTCCVTPGQLTPSVMNVLIA
jgi:uncharacterized Zn-binding protein involved in type VI secretion